MKQTFNLRYAKDFDDAATYLEATKSFELPSDIKGSFDHLISSASLLVEFSPAELVIDVYLRSEKHTYWATKLERVYFQPYYCLYIAKINGQRFLVGYQYRRFTPKFFVNAWGSTKIDQLDDATGLLYRLADSQTRDLLDISAVYSDFLRKENLLELDVTYSDYLNVPPDSRSDAELTPQDNSDDPVFDSLIGDSPNLLTDDENEVYSRQPR